MPVDVMLRSMSEDEYLNWFAYVSEYEQSDVNELQMAVLTNIAMSFAGSKKKTTYKDFLIRDRSKGKKAPIGNEAIKNVFLAMTIEK